MASLRVTSTAFAQGERIPQRYTCEGENVSPPLSWDNVPEQTASLAIICDDPDAGRTPWVHWVLYNLPRNSTSILAGAPKDEELQDGARQGLNTSRRTGYDGPCPPPGSPHRYFFHVYALDTMLDPARDMTKEKLLKEMEGHLLAEGEVMGKCQR